MSHDLPMSPELKRAIQEDTALSEKRIEIMRDDQTVFALAVLMMDLHVATLLKNKNGAANCLMKAGVVLRNNAGFPARFKAAQQAVIDQMRKQGPPDPNSVPLPTDTALNIRKENGQVIDLPTKPPEDQL